MWIFLWYGGCVRHLAVRSGEHYGISPFANKRMQPRKNSVISHHLSNCNYSFCSEDFSVMYHKNKKYPLEVKGNHFIVRDRPSTN